MSSAGKWAVVLVLGIAPALPLAALAKPTQEACDEVSRSRGVPDKGLNVGIRAAEGTAASENAPGTPRLAHAQHASSRTQTRLRIDWRFACAALAGLYLLFAGMLSALFAPMSDQPQCRRSNRFQALLHRVTQTGVPAQRSRRTETETPGDPASAR